MIAVAAISCKQDELSYITVKLNRSGKLVKVLDAQKVYMTEETQGDSILLQSPGNGEWYISQKDFLRDTTITSAEGNPGSRLQTIQRQYRFGKIINQYTTTEDQ